MNKFIILTSLSVLYAVVFYEVHAQNDTGEINNIGNEALKIFIKYEDEETGIIEVKWKSWVFGIELSGWFSEEESNKSVALWSSFTAEKITPA